MTRLRVTLLCVLALAVCSVSHAATPKKIHLTLDCCGTDTYIQMGALRFACAAWVMGDHRHFTFFCVPDPRKKAALKKSGSLKS